MRRLYISGYIQAHCIHVKAQLRERDPRLVVWLRYLSALMGIHY